MGGSKCQCGDPVYLSGKHCLDCLLELRTGQLSPYAISPIAGIAGKRDTIRSDRNTNDEGEDSPLHENAVRELEDCQ